MSKKLKDPNRLRGGQYVATTMMSMADSAAAAIMTGTLMVFLTDYADLGSLGAILGGILMFAARLIDAVDDTVQGWLVDRAKPTKIGKYRPFLLISILCTTIGASMLFLLPSGISKNSFAVCTWVILFYLMYDIGSSFNVANLLYRVMTHDEMERGKLLIGPRVGNMIIGAVGGAALTPIIVGIAGTLETGYHGAYNLVMPIFVCTFGVLALIGWFLVKEKESKDMNETDEPVKITDIFLLFKENPPFRAQIIGKLFGGFIWTFLFATAAYYMKYAYCVDLATGVLNDSLYGMYSAYLGGMMIMPLLLGTLIAGPITRKIGDPKKANILFLSIQAGGCGLLYVFQILGVLPTSAIFFFVPMFVTTLAMGAAFFPGGIIEMEIMDYNIYKTGKDRSAQANAVSKFIDKMQGAFSSGIVGFTLAAIGYQADSVTGNFTGDLSVMPVMLNRFVLIMGLIPCILGFIQVFVFAKFYPVNNTMRGEIKAYFDKRRSE